MKRGMPDAESFEIKKPAVLILFWDQGNWWQGDASANTRNSMCTHSVFPMKQLLLNVIASESFL